MISEGEEKRSINTFRNGLTSDVYSPNKFTIFLKFPTNIIVFAGQALTKNNKHHGCFHSMKL